MSKKITQLDEGTSLNKDEYYMIIAGNGENRKVKLSNLLMASVDNLEELNLITSEKVEEWDNKSDFDGDYESLSNKPDLITEADIKDKYMSREEYNSLLKKIEDLENK